MTVFLARPSPGSDLSTTLGWLNTDIPSWSFTCSLSSPTPASQWASTGLCSRQLHPFPNLPFGPIHPLGTTCWVPQANLSEFTLPTGSRQTSRQAFQESIHFPSLSGDSLPSPTHACPPTPVLAEGLLHSWAWGNSSHISLFLEFPAELNLRLSSPCLSISFSHACL